MIDDVDALIKEAQALKGRGHVELMAAARALDGDSAPDEVDAIVLEAVTLKPTAKRQLFNTIKKHTGIPLGTLKEAEQSMEGHEEYDDLSHARALADDIGRDNVLAASTFVWRWICLLYTSPSPRDRG